MSLIRRLILALALSAGLAPAFAAAPAPVPALPDLARINGYAINTSLCNCAVGFQLYGDGTDYQNWIEVWINGFRVDYNHPTNGWTVTSPSGPLANLARPITDAVVNFNSVQTGTIQIVGARRPRQNSQFSENGVTARSLNQRLTDTTATLREIWDKTNDVTGRGIFAQPGVTLGPLPQPAACANNLLGFDATGLNPTCVAVLSTQVACGPAFSFPIFSGGVWKCSTDPAPLAAILNGTLNINPLVGSTQQGFVINQTGPAGGSTLGPLYFNFINSFFNSTVTGSPTVSGLQVSLGIGASANAVEINAGSFGVTVTQSGSVGEPVGVTSGAEVLAGVSTGSNIYGAASASIVRVGAHTPQQTGHESDNFLFSALVPARFGYNSGSFGDHNATTFEAAYGVFTAGGSTNSWKNVIGLYSFGGTLSAPVSTDANFFTSDFAITMSRILDLRNFTVTNAIIETASKTKLTDGGLTLGSNAVAGSLAMNGPNGGAVYNSFQSSGVPRWTEGITTTNDYAIDDVENSRFPLVISKSSGLTTIGYGLNVSGTLTFGGFTFALAGNTSLPAIAQGDLWYGSAAGTISALAKDAGTSRFLKNSGTSNNPAWAQPAFTDISGSVAASQMPAFTGDITTSAGAVATTLATVNSNVGTFGSATQSVQLTVNGKGLVTAAANVTISIPTSALTGILQAAQEPAHTGDVTNTAGSLALSIANNAVTLAKLATQGANTVLVNATSGSAVPTALAVGSCDTATKALQWTTNTGFGCNTSITAAAVAGTGITGGATWTPALKFGAAAVGMTTSVAAGRIIQLGNGVVLATARITLTAKGSSTGPATITGLPTSVGGVEGNVHFSYYQNLASITSVPFGYISASGTTINLQNSGAASTTNLTEADFTNTSDFIFAVIYHTN